MCDAQWNGENQDDENGDKGVATSQKVLLAADAEELEYLSLLPPEVRKTYSLKFSCPAYTTRLIVSQIWKYILDMVNDPADLETLCNSSPFFRDILMDERVKFLAPGALKLMVASGYLTAQRLDRTSLGRSVDLPTCYTARSVCKLWNKGVDAYYEDRFTNKRLQFTSKFGKKLRFNTVPSPDFLSRDDSISFVYHFMDSHEGSGQNPFFGRAVEVTLAHGTLDILMGIFRLHGRHIWGFRFNNYGILHLNTLYGFLLVMPNLRRFEISDFRGHIERPNIILPPLLPSLVTFKSTLEFALQTGLLMGNPSIENLQLEIGRVQGQHLLFLPNLKQLKAVLQPNVGLIWFETPQLRVLTIHWKRFHPEETRDTLKDLQEYIKCINRNWANVSSLKEIEIELPGGARRAGDVRRMLLKGGSLQLELRYVERMKLLVYTPVMLDSLMPARETLKYLRVKLLCHYISMPNTNSLTEAKNLQKIQFVCFEKRMYDSNIWILFPRLQEIVVEGHLSYESKTYIYSFDHCDIEIYRYNRAEWERRMLAV